jgi:predicted transcriptional regulator
METVVIELDPETGKRARRLARARGITVETLVQNLITQLDWSEAGNDQRLICRRTDTSGSGR